MILAVNLDQHFHNDVLQIGLRAYFCIFANKGISYLICIITHNAVWSAPLCTPVSAAG